MALLVIIALGVLFVHSATLIKDADATEVAVPAQLRIGTSTSAYQIEGAWNKDGRGPSIWDEFSHRYPERITDGSNGDVAANSYELYKEDVQLIKSLGMQFYRFSISWTRILPEGDLKVINDAGIDYYNRLIDNLLENGIEPIVTMFHHDLPQAFAPFGGLTNSIFIKHFVAYADLLFKLYGDRVKLWITHNEPLAICEGSYGLGIHPPAVAAQGIGEYLCLHNLLLSHAKVYHMYRQKYYESQKGRLSILAFAFYGFPDPTANDTAEQSAEYAERFLQFQIGWLMHPILKGDYPPVMRQRIDENSRREGRAFSRLPEFTADELVEVKGTIDFFTYNYYTSRTVTEIASDDMKEKMTDLLWYKDVHLQQNINPEWPSSINQWIYSVPEGLGKVLRWIKKEYNNPEVMIIENGWPGSEGLQDHDRVQFFREHLLEVVGAINDGCNVTAYSVWSLLDNYEWNSGYTQKFGLYHVNFTSGARERTPRLSAGFMRDVNLNRAIPVE